MLALPLLATSSFADSVLLENEETVQGRIISATNEIITIETNSGQVLELPTSKIKLINYGAGTAPPPGPVSFVVYLESGEIIQGKITQFTDDFVTVESKEGYGVLQIPTSKVNYITSSRVNIDLSQRNGIGYVQRQSTLSSPSGISSYSSNQLSYKFFLEENLFGNIMLAYGNATYGSSKIQVLSADYKMGLIFRKMQNMLLYYGGSLGYIQIKDDSTNVDGSGTGYSAFAGAEIFFPSLPNFGFSAEIGYGMKTAGDYSSADLSISTFPAFSIHYYY